MSGLNLQPLFMQTASLIRRERNLFCVSAADMFAAAQQLPVDEPNGLIDGHETCHQPPVPNPSRADATAFVKMRARLRKRDLDQAPSPTNQLPMPQASAPAPMNSRAL